MQSQDLSAVGYLVRDLEDIAVGITHHGTPVAVWRVQRSFQRFSARLQRSPVGLIGVGNIDIEESREEVPLARWREHQERVADTDLGWVSLLDIAGAVEDGAQELDRPVQVGDDDARRQGVVAVRHAFDRLTVACSKPSIDAGPGNRRVAGT